MTGCLICASAVLRHPSDTKADQARRAMAKLGLVCCTASPHAATFRPMGSTCTKFVHTDAETATARRAWEEKNHGQAARP